MNIVEYPYNGVITRTTVVTQDNGDTDVTTIEVYDGKIDVSLSTAEMGAVAQTSNYVVSMPLLYSGSNAIIPKKDDKIAVNMLGDTFVLTVNLSIPSQLGGVTVYASRGDY